jgi:hypothetical protein
LHCIVNGLSLSGTGLRRKPFNITVVVIIEVIITIIDV